MKQLLIAALAGAVFGAGLTLSGMADPRVVLAFLKLGPGWNPQLLFVMIAALAVSLPGFAWMRRRGRPYLAKTFIEPNKRQIDKPLLTGAMIFGAGWGLAGLCPGPAIVSAGFLQPEGLLFLPAMLIGGIVAPGFTRIFSGNSDQPEVASQA